MQLILHTHVPIIYEKTCFVFNELKNKLLFLVRKSFELLKSLFQSLGLSSFVLFRSIGFFNSSLSLKLEVIWLRSSMAFCNFFSSYQQNDSEKRALQQKVDTYKEGMHRTFDESCHLQIDALEKLEMVETLQRKKLEIEKENHLLILKNKILEGELAALKDFQPVLETLEEEKGPSLEKQLKITHLYKIQLEKLVEQIEIDQKAFSVSKEALEHFANLLGVAQRSLKHFEAITKYLNQDMGPFKQIDPKVEETPLEELVLRLKTTLGAV